MTESGHSGHNMMIQLTSVLSVDQFRQVSSLFQNLQHMYHPV